MHVVSKDYPLWADPTDELLRLKCKSKLLHLHLKRNDQSLILMVGSFNEKKTGYQQKILRQPKNINLIPKQNMT